MSSAAVTDTSPYPASGYATGGGSATNGAVTRGATITATSAVAVRPSASVTVKDTVAGVAVDVDSTVTCMRNCWFPCNVDAVDAATASSGTLSPKCAGVPVARNVTRQPYPANPSDANPRRVTATSPTVGSACSASATAAASAAAGMAAVVSPPNSSANVPETSGAPDEARRMANVGSGSWSTRTKSTASVSMYAAWAAAASAHAPHVQANVVLGPGSSRGTPPSSDSGGNADDCTNSTCHVKPPWWSTVDRDTTTPNPSGAKLGSAVSLASKEAPGTASSATSATASTAMASVTANSPVVLSGSNPRDTKSATRSVVLKARVKVPLMVPAVADVCTTCTSRGGPADSTTSCTAAPVASELQCTSGRKCTELSAAFTAAGRPTTSTDDHHNSADGSGVYTNPATSVTAAAAAVAGALPNANPPPTLPWAACTPVGHAVDRDSAAVCARAEPGTRATPMVRRSMTAPCATVTATVSVASKSSSASGSDTPTPGITTASFSAHVRDVAPKCSAGGEFTRCTNTDTAADAVCSGAVTHADVVASHNAVAPKSLAVTVTVSTPRRTEFHPGCGTYINPANAPFTSAGKPYSASVGSSGTVYTAGARTAKPSRATASLTATAAGAASVSPVYGASCGHGAPVGCEPSDTCHTYPTTGQRNVVPSSAATAAGARSECRNGRRVTDTCAMGPDPTATVTPWAASSAAAPAVTPPAAAVTSPAAAVMVVAAVASSSSSSSSSPPSFTHSASIPAMAARKSAAVASTAMGADIALLPADSMNVPAAGATPAASSATSAAAPAPDTPEASTVSGSTSPPPTKLVDATSAAAAVCCGSATLRAAYVTVHTYPTVASTSVPGSADATGPTGDRDTVTVPARCGSSTASKAAATAAASACTGNGDVVDTPAASGCAAMEADTRRGVARVNVPPRSLPSATAPTCTAATADALAPGASKLVSSTTSMDGTSPSAWLKVTVHAMSPNAASVDTASTSTTWSSSTDRSAAPNS